MKPDDKPLIEFDRPAVIDRREDVLSRDQVQQAKRVLHKYDELIFDVLPEPDGFCGYEVIWRQTFGGEKPNGVTRRMAIECWRKHCLYRSVSCGERNRAFLEFEERREEFERRMILAHIQQSLTW